MNATRSKVVIHTNNNEPVLGVAAQLLDVLGHEVAMVESPDAALSAATREPVDLLVLSLADFDEQSHRLDQIALLPKSERPKQVAILSDSEDDDPLLRRRVPDLKVHVFTKSIHAMGLLNVIKRMKVAS